MKKRTIAFIVALAVSMLVLDLFMIAVWRKTYFERAIERVNCGRPVCKTRGERALFAALVYGAMVAAVTVFAFEQPARAALLGCIVYTVFDGTLFVMSDAWNVQDAVVDIVWGTTLFFLATTIATRTSALVP
jgi:uncharacterized membrane protein